MPSCKPNFYAEFSHYLSSNIPIVSFAIKLCRLLGLQGNYSTEHAIRFIVTASTLRIIYLFFFPLSLIGDESYYWEWGRNLDWGYYSKPPMIGWLMGIIHFLGADSAFFVRLPTIFFGAGVLFIIFQLGKNIFSAKVGFYAMLFLCLSPAHSVLSLVFTIDAPLLLFWSFALLAFWKVFFEKGDNKWAIGLIISLGLANLTKQMSLVFPLIATLILYSYPDKRKYLRVPGYWIGWLISILFLLPPFLWNQQNDWITFSHTASHLKSSSPDILKRFSFLSEFFVTQAFIIGPVIFFAAIFLFSRKLNRIWKNRGQRFLLLFSLPAFFLFLLLSLTQRVNPNWPAVFYIPFFLLVVSYFLEENKSLLSKQWKNLKATNFLISSILLVFLYGSPFVLSGLQLEGTGYDLFKRMRGYNQFADEVIQIKKNLTDTENLDLVVIGHRYDACQLAFHAQGQPFVHIFPSSDLIESQYDIWSKNYTFGTKKSLLIRNTHYPLPSNTEQIFGKIHKLPQNIRIPFPTGKQLFFDLYLAEAQK